MMGGVACREVMVRYVVSDQAAIVKRVKIAQPGCKYRRQR